MEAISNIFQVKSRHSLVMQEAYWSMVVAATNEFLEAEAGEGITAAARALYLSHGVLTIACLTAAAQAKIELNTAKIQALINAKFGPNTVEKLNFIS